MTVLGRKAPDRGTRVVLVVLIAAVLIPPTAAAAEVGARPVSAERWVRTVCRDVLTWLEDTDESGITIFDTVDQLDTGDVSAKEARKDLVEATADQVKTTGELVDGVKDAGTPRVDDGKAIARDYLTTLGDYQDAFERANKAYTNEKTKNEDKFADAVTEIDMNLIADLEEIGFDPLEELRDVPDLATAIDSETACADVDSFLEVFAPVALLQVGDCVVEILDDLFALETVDCATSHAGEVFSVVEHPAGPGEPFPGNQAIDAYVEQACVSPFQSYVGISFAQSRLDFSYWSPTEDSWNAGDRQYVCVAQTIDRTPLVGSVMGTAE